MASPPLRHIHVPSITNSLRSSINWGAPQTPKHFKMCSEVNYQKLPHFGDQESDLNYLEVSLRYPTTPKKFIGSLTRFAPDESDLLWLIKKTREPNSLPHHPIIGKLDVVPCIFSRDRCLERKPEPPIRAIFY